TPARAALLPQVVQLLARSSAERRGRGLEHPSGILGDQPSASDWSHRPSQSAAAAMSHFHDTYSSDHPEAIRIGWCDGTSVYLDETGAVSEAACNRVRSEPNGTRNFVSRSRTLG
ncbi:MAG TPA: hypothetical protein VKP69_31345, partial [Isosphaeraceae bacterium]|nr:hypothetical protein [Isosphaeraceae bacterium]